MSDEVLADHNHPRVLVILEVPVSSLLETQPGDQVFHGNTAARFSFHIRGGDHFIGLLYNMGKSASEYVEIKIY